MNKTKYSPIDNTNKKTMNTANLAKYLDCGRATAVKIGLVAGARIKIGKRVLWNVSKIEEYLNANSSNEDMR